MNKPIRITLNAESSQKLAELLTNQPTHTSATHVLNLLIAEAHAAMNRPPEEAPINDQTAPATQT